MLVIRLFAYLEVTTYKVSDCEDVAEVDLVTESDPVEVEILPGEGDELPDHGGRSLP